MVKICPECHKENVDTNKFCEYCGSNLPIEEGNNVSKSIRDNPREVIKQNVDAIKDKVDSTVTEEKLARNEKKIKKQKDEIAKNQELIDRQNKDISNNKTVNNDEFHKLKYKLLYWNDKKTNEYKFSKTKFISIIVFLFFCIYAMISSSHLGLIPAIIIGLIFAVPTFILGYIIHYLMNRK